ncbi:leucine--tRNA ligase [Plasmodiophora brassicae]|uniref:leucine--tRNA ligase n=1 Tax=Plasmodiophora brassicae TaxID=37360 RepID=A0A3P3Y752_PLABS|nr:unnamed protein product [Plasmodiophora brassicae]
MTEEKQSFDRRDRLIALEKIAQEKWEQNKSFEVDAPEPGDPLQEKFMVTFPFPYMNGILHLGHAFSLSKAEFAAGYQRMKGRRVLFPFGFHCTGMPIAACAEKLRREIEAFGNPPEFPTDDGDDASEDAIAAPEVAASAPKKKGKLSKKSSKNRYQWQIMEEIGVPPEMIASFADPKTWLAHFPPIAIEHLKRFGIKADFRRSFITTNVNPYFDAFIRWQFNTLKRLGKIMFGKRLSIFSPNENQPCADHDRASGEGVVPQEYTAIKLRLVSKPPPALQSFVDEPSHSGVFLLCATLRPETMYGQTNAWVLPHGDYSCIRGPNSEIWVCSARAAANMSYQELLPTPFGKVETLCVLKGWDLLGAAVKAPNAIHDVIYMLPLLTIKMNKGTGIVTSVPSDSPDDYTALEDLRKDEAFRVKYHVTLEMVSLEAPAIIRTPSLGDRAAKFMCEKMKIANQYDSKKLAEAKLEVYKQGFYEGTMLVGMCAGQPVEIAKPIVKADMISKGQAFSYSEPEREVIARSGNECVVAKTDQWFEEYGEENWRKDVEKHVRERLETYNDIAKEQFIHVVNWLKEWACSRSFGLGTPLPFDPKFVIESLSDSTIYMAYYTIAHILQHGVLNGSQTPATVVRPEQLTDAVFDYIFKSENEDAGIPPECDISVDVLHRMRREFRYFYPVDLRCSGKDLIGNHLTMSLYNHAAMWKSEPALWPRSFYTNGHAMLNDEKMSKSTGNFITMVDACKQYGTDPTRLALADAGDTLDDANVSLVHTGDSAILKLTKELDWIQETFDRINAEPATRREFSLVDKIFNNRINECIHAADKAFARMHFRVALKHGFFDLLNARDLYRASFGEDASKMNSDLLRRYVDVFALLIAPICPHTAEEIWRIAGHSGMIIDAPWPTADEVDLEVSAIAKYLQEVTRAVNVKFGEAMQPKKGPAPTTHPSTLTFYVAREYPAWQKTVLKRIEAIYQEDPSKPVDLGRVSRDIKDVFTRDPELKANLKRATKFAIGVVDEVKSKGRQALATEMPFDERQLLEQNISMMIHGIHLTNPVAVTFDDTGRAAPGNPTIRFTWE